MASVPIGSGVNRTVLDVLPVGGAPNPLAEVLLQRFGVAPPRGLRERSDRELMTDCWKMRTYSIIKSVPSVSSNPTRHQRGTRTTTAPSLVAFRSHSLAFRVDVRYDSEHALLTPVVVVGRDRPALQPSRVVVVGLYAVLDFGRRSRSKVRFQRLPDVLSVVRVDDALEILLGSVYVLADKVDEGIVRVQRVRLQVRLRDSGVRSRQRSSSRSCS